MSGNFFLLVDRRRYGKRKPWLKYKTHTQFVADIHTIMHMCIHMKYSHEFSGTQPNHEMSHSIGEIYTAFETEKDKRSKKKRKKSFFFSLLSSTLACDQVPKLDIQPIRYAHIELEIFIIWSKKNSHRNEKNVALIVALLWTTHLGSYFLNIVAYYDLSIHSVIPILMPIY